jgi:hypothetical protein
VITGAGQIVVGGPTATVFNADIYTSSAIAVSVNYMTSAAMCFARTYTPTSAVDGVDLYGLRAILYWQNDKATNSSSLTGFAGEVYINNIASGRVYTVRGVYAYIGGYVAQTVTDAFCIDMLFPVSAMTVTNARSVNAKMPTVGTGSITTGTGVYIVSPTKGAGTYGTANGLYIENISVASTNYAIYTNAGLNRLGDQVSIAGSADRQQLIVTGYTTQAVATPLVQFTRNDAAAGLSVILGLTALGSGANSDGGSISFAGKSSTTVAQAMGLDQWYWVNATHNSRTARRVFNVYDTAIREGMRIEASGSAPMIGFLGSGAVVKQTGPVSQETGYIAGQLDSEAEIIAAFNTTNEGINVIRTALINYGLVTDE